MWITLSKWRKVWQLQGELVPASEKDAEQLEQLRQASFTLPLASVSEAVDANEKHFRAIKAEGA